MNTADKFIALILMSCALLLSACEPRQAVQPPQFKAGDSVPFSGSYKWVFKLGPYQQVSQNDFHPDYIDYSMRGKVYSTNYRIKRLSYDASSHKWLGQDNSGNYYVLFIDAKDNDKLLIYKKKFKGDWQQALAFTRPAADDTSNHGWNIYQQSNASDEQPVASDPMPLSGKYLTTSEQIQFGAEHTLYNGIIYKMLSHHSGERRWLGQSNHADARTGKEFLLVFYDIAANGEVYLYTKAGADLEALYRIKHQRGSLYQPQS